MIIRGNKVKVIDLVPVEKLMREHKCIRCGHTYKEHDILDSNHTFCRVVITVAGGDIYCGCRNFRADERL